MNTGEFSTEAAILWNPIPAEARERILNNVFCSKCRAAVRIVDFEATVIKEGDLILKGKCAKCGNKIVRLVETSERRVENN